MVIFIAAGGTGGHIIPAIAVADAIKARRPDCRIVFIGTGKEIERKLVGQAGYELEAVELLPFSGKGIAGKLKLLLSLPAAVRAVNRLFSGYKPACIAGFGGYPSFLPVFSAWLRGIPRIINEQNVKAGVANRVLSLIATAGFAVPGAYSFCRPKIITFVPNPVRSRFFEVPDWNPPAEERPLKILVVGGSQGAVSLNTAILDCADKFNGLGVSLVHQAGAKDLARVASRYSEVDPSRFSAVEFIDDLASAYGAADIVICRAGAMTVAEICAAGRAAIFVPLPIAGGHQAENARWLVDSGAALMLAQDAALSEKLFSAVAGLAADKAKILSLAATIRQAAVGAGKRSSDLVAEKILESAAKGA